MNTHSNTQNNTEPKALSLYELNTNIDEMTRMASSVLKLISCEFAKDNEQNRIADDILYFSIETVIYVIDDIKNTVDAYFNAHYQDKNQA